MKFTRLRLSGFKSFVEPTELFLESGLTAIVGPNGCGKSNLFDALRWVMGETRPTSIRGAEMDDVIFAGSAARPARNTAEVTLFVDNTDRTATAPYNEFDAIEISRRIEREAGSAYRINGRDVRQRDVQIFFADASSGATSTAFVRQGQIGLLISQKPLARRAILEEAAGIAGLHQRRHEAELRLRAAEANIARVDDVIRELESQLQNLKRQARAAARYRNISGLIRKAEALALHLRWLQASAQLSSADAALKGSAAVVAECTARSAEAAAAQSHCASDLPPLRQAEAETGAALHRLILAREALDSEEERARSAAQLLRQRISQTEGDMARDRALHADADAAMAKLEAERRSLDEESVRAAREIESADERKLTLGDALADSERDLERIAADLADWNAKKQSHTRAREVADALDETSSQQLSEAQARLDAAREVSGEHPDVHSSEQSATHAQKAAAVARDELSAKCETLAAAEAALSEERLPLENVEREVQRLSAEAKALGDLLRPQGTDLWPPLVDSVQVQSGYEAALAAALGDDLQAPVDEAAPHHWRNLGNMESVPQLPEGTKPLSDFVQGPQALKRRLAFIGVVAREAGAKMQSALRPGQRLVTQRGDLWRWDGYTASADAPSTSAIRLSQRNRLSALEEELAVARSERTRVFDRFSAAKAASDGAREDVRLAEQNARGAQQSALTAQELAARAARTAVEQNAQLARLEAETKRLELARDAAREASRSARISLAELGDGRALLEGFAKAKENAGNARAVFAEISAALESIRRECQQREHRTASVSEERELWQSRGEAAQQHIAELIRRLEETASELARVESVPAALMAKRNALLDTISQAEAARNAAADTRVQAEHKLAEADKAARAADAALATAREERARLDAVAESAGERLAELRSRIGDELDASPEELPQRADLKDNQELPTLEHADKRVERLKQEREQLGGVNLRAEEEAAECGLRLETLVRDRADLDGAIQRLRRGIQNLNREGRDRLLQSFEKVNENFQLLFTKLFEGGEAKLTFTESDDPLEAGLEIFARPPGKRLQSLSLLSGGEQALTALALIFAVFLVNPAPVCVLDEVDAPLDDANVERFCNLLDEMTRLTETRFLVITHHALTMSRVHRLFGVTMAERGVSQLVSVSLAEAAQAAAVAAE